MALFCLGYSLLIRSLPHALQIVGSWRLVCLLCPVPLYLSNPQSIFQRLGHSRANWRNCYWFSFFVYLWSFPEPFLEYSHPIMDKVRFVDQPKLEESDIWKNRRHCCDDCAINYVSSEFSKCTSGSLIFSPIAKLPIKLAMIGGASMGAIQMRYIETVYFRCTSWQYIDGSDAQFGRILTVGLSDF